MRILTTRADSWLSASRDALHKKSLFTGSGSLWRTRNLCASALSITWQRFTAEPQRYAEFAERLGQVVPATFCAKPYRDGYSTVYSAAERRCCIRDPSGVVRGTIQRAGNRLTCSLERSTLGSIINCGWRPLRETITRARTSTFS